MHDITTPNSEHESVLTALRALLPQRRLRFAEALRVAELQADRLLRLQGINDLPIPVEVVTAMPRIAVDRDPDLPLHAASGASHWDQSRKTWIISINPDEPATRQRFTVMHEYKHIIDHYHPGLGGRLPRTFYGLDPVEYVAEYFAGCLLMPKRLVKAAFFDGIQRIADLAELFDVSQRAMQVRVDQLGITRASDEPAQAAPRYRLQPQAHGYIDTARYHRPLSLRLVAEEIST